MSRGASFASIGVRHREPRAAGRNLIRLESALLVSYEDEGLPLMSPWPFDPLVPFSFDFVVADPPWPWETYSEKGARKSPSAQYATMTMEQIRALPIGDLLAPRGVLFLWCTWPLISLQAQLPAHWGLTMRTGGVWAKRTPSGKLRWGPGYLLRSVCEPFLIAALDGHEFKGRSVPNLIDGVAREHSRKPDEVFAAIDRVLPEARKLDLFARQSRTGWTAWGDQLTKFDEKRA